MTLKTLTDKKIPAGIKETKYPGYFIDESGNAYRVPGKYDKNTKLNEYGLVPLNTHLRGNPAHKKYQYPSINVTLRDENGKYLRQKKENIHRLVAEAFIPNPYNYDSVDHKDRNKHNNHVSNLRWCSIDDNKRSWERDEKYLMTLSLSSRGTKVCGVGINDSEGLCKKDKNYNRWVTMLHQCKKKKIDLCEEWKTYSNFNDWIQENNFDDDSILYLIQGNEYCPENCVKTTYNFINILSFKKRGKYPLGVSLSNGGRGKATRYNVKTKQCYLGSYSSIEEAHLAWQKQKIKEIDFMIKNEQDKRIINVLRAVKNSVQDDIDNKKETLISPFI